MKKQICFWIVLFFSISAVIGIDVQRSYYEQITFINELGNNFSHTIVGNVSYDEASYPVYKITYNPNSKNNHKYLVLCGVHGNEPAPIFAISTFIKTLDRQQVDVSSPSIDFIYIVNPWGFIYNQRANGDNIDINRDITTQASQEAKILRKAVSINDYQRVFDFHEGNTEGYYVYYYSKKQKNTISDIISLYKESNLPLENRYKDIILQSRDGVIYVPWYAGEYMKNKKTVTTTLWSYDNGIEGSFTIETSKNRPIEERKAIIQIILEKVVRKSF